MPVAQSRRKANISLGLNLLLLLLVGAVYGGIQLRHYYQQLQPSWSGLSMQWGRVQAEQLSLTLPYAATHQLEIRQLDLRWSGWPWPLDVLQVEQLIVQSAPVWPQPDSSEEGNLSAEGQVPGQLTSTEHATPDQVAVVTPEAADSLLQQLWPYWLPSAVQVKQLQLQLPCAELDKRLTAFVSTPDVKAHSNSQCLLSGSVSLDSQQKKAQLRLLSEQPLLIEGLGDVQPEVQFTAQPDGNQIQISFLQVKFRSKVLTYGTSKLDNTELALQATGRWQQGKLVLQSTAAATMSTQLTAPELSWQQGQFSIEDWALELPWPDWQQASLSASLAMQLKQLEQQALYPQDWIWHAKVSGSLAEPKLSGVLTSGNSLVLNHQLQRKNQQYQLSWQLPELFFLAGNPLKLGPAWPELLTISRGKLSGEGKVMLAGDNFSLLSGEQQLQLMGIDGIWDRSEFKGLTGVVALKHSARDWLLSSKALELAQINHGMVAGPVKFAGSYQFLPEQMTAGQLQLNQLQLALFAGLVQVKPGRFDLSKDQQFELELQQLQLADLLKQRPEAGVSGQGSISGRIPLRWTAQGVTVAQGQIGALAPGGLLKFESDKAKALAQSNQGMQVLMQALQNFHYSVLSADVSYATSGQLLLALHLEGKNPDYENGRAINLNINLEENIPALLASLQLSGQVSELVKKRVQQRLAAKQAKAAKEQP
ncbi:YdbH domain-containing protein [Rheinheimera marina]|uniref:YdbH domain-containing protein n=1 Tax=Rheinheimera marina TaxID=1774958 RepID=A0ABV9JNN3_9GAMM